MEKVIAVMGVLSLYFLSILHFFILFLVFFWSLGKVGQGIGGKERKTKDAIVATHLKFLACVDEISSKMWWLRGTLFFVTTAMLEYLKFME